MTTTVRKLLLAIVTAVLAFTLAACGGDDSGGGDSGGGAEATDSATAGGGDGLTVSVQDNEFIPADLTVSAGDTVTWQWEGQIPHNVVGDGFESDTMTEGTFEYTFETAGEYPYECTIHPGMEGTITVQ